MKYDKDNEESSRTEKRMRRKNIMNIGMITVGAIIIMAFIGTGVYHSSASQNNSELSPDKIKEMVSDQYPGTITELEQEQEYNKVVYKVEVVSEEKEYDIKLDGNTGEVIKLEEKTVQKKDGKGHSEGKDEVENDESHSKKEHHKENYNNQSNVKVNEKVHHKSKNRNKQKKNNPEQIAIDAKEAIDIALNEYSGIVTELELDRNNGQYYYEVEIQSGHEEVEIEIDAHTGEILVIEIDD